MLFLQEEGEVSARGHKMGWSAAFQVQMGSDDPSSRKMAEWGDQLLCLVRDYRPSGFTKMIGKSLVKRFPSLWFHA